MGGTSVRGSAAVHVAGVTKRFGERIVVDVPELMLGRHPIEGLIGPNGAGKTTLLRLLVHALPADTGTITFRAAAGSAVSVSATPQHRLARHGLVKTNQVIQDFASLTIWDSLLLAVATRRDERPHRLFGDRALLREHTDEVHTYLDKFEFADPFGYARSGGEKKLLDILRCLILQPQMLLLDEPAAGLPADVAERVIELIAERATAGMAVVLVEHDLDLVWQFCPFVHFMAEGRVLLHGSPGDVRGHSTVVEKYLGARRA